MKLLSLVIFTENTGPFRPKRLQMCSLAGKFHTSISPSSAHDTNKQSSLEKTIFLMVKADSLWREGSRAPVSKLYICIIFLRVVHPDTIYMLSWLRTSVLEHKKFSESLFKKPGFKALC